MENHSIHRLHEFLPYMARRQPELLALLPQEEQPGYGVELKDWVWSLPQKRLLEICATWVVESMRLLRESSPLTGVLMRGCLYFAGEFNLSDVAALAVGEIPPLGDPRREEIRVALQRAVRIGVLIYLPEQERYCVPFPVRLAFEGADFLDPLESDTIRMRMVHHFAGLARELSVQPELASPKYWRFSNMLLAYEAAVDLTEDYLGLDSVDWSADSHEEYSIPESLARPLIEFVNFLGQAIVLLHSGNATRLLGASAAAAREHSSVELEADIWAMLGQFHLRQRAFPPAIRCYRAAERLRTSINDYRGAILHSGAVAIAFREMGDHELAAREFLGACEIARREKLREEEVDNANCAARLLLERDRAFEVLQLGHDVALSLGEDRVLLPNHAELLVNLGVALRQCERPEEAHQTLSEAVESARGITNRPVEARGLFELARLSRSEECPDQALGFLGEARRLYLEIADCAGETECLLEKARILRSQEEWTSAESALRKALRSAQEAGNPILLSTVYRERGHLAWEQGETATAISQFSEETGVLRKTRHTTLLVEAHLRLAEAYFDQESFLAAGTEIFRGQAISRAYLPGEDSPELAVSVARIYKMLTLAQIDYLLDEVSEELEAGKLRRA